MTYIIDGLDILILYLIISGWQYKTIREDLNINNNNFRQIIFRLKNKIIDNDGKIH